MKESVCYDVCIVGAGPHALSVLSALHTPVASLSEQQHTRRRRGSRSKVRSEEVPRRPSVLVMDPSGEWLHEWSERFAALDIAFLRSPSWAHPDAFSREALVEFARREERLEELRAVDLSASTLHGSPDVEAGYFSLPGTALFGDFCAELARSLPHTLVRGRVMDIASASDTYELTVHTANTERCCDQPGCKKDLSESRYHAKHVVLALGASGPPNIPRAFAGLASQTEGAARPRVVHTSDWRNLAFVGTDSADTVLVIGGGLSAAQAALLAVKRGARKTILCSRRPLVSRHYDIPLEFMDRRISNKWKEWHFLAGAERAAYIKRERGGGSVPPDYLEALDDAVLDGRLEVVVNSVRSATGPGEAKKEVTATKWEGVRVIFDDDSTLEASQVVLATGGTQDSLKLPLVAALAERFRLPLREGLPLVDQDLLWHDGISVVGALAAGQLGPDAGNLTGARRAATMCADTIGVFDDLREGGAILGNLFSVLASGDSEEEE
jgi:hypothetical protein